MKVMSVQRAHMVFLQIAELGNLTAASRKLNVAQPSLTRTIKSLERNVGAKLFERKNNGMVLTPAGRVLERYLKSMLITYNRALSDLAAMSKGHVDEIRIGCGAAYLILIMPDLIEELCRQFPQTAFHVASGSASQLTNSLLSGDLDIVISARSSNSFDPSIRVTNLGQIRHGIVHWPGTLKNVSAGDLLSASDLVGQEWVLFESEPELSTAIWDLFSREGLPTPLMSSTTNSINLSLELVQRRPVISSLPNILRDHLLARGFLFNEISDTIWRKESGICISQQNLDHPVLNSIIALVTDLVDRRRRGESGGPTR